MYTQAITAFIIQINLFSCYALLSNSAYIMAIADTVKLISHLMFHLLVDWLAAGMKATYSSMGIQKSPEEKDTWPPTIVKSYISLALMHQKNLQTSEITTEATHIRTKGNISDMPQIIHCKELTFEDIFLPVSTKKVNKILIEGHPGIGKTTLVKQICGEWAEGKLLTSDKLVLLLLLRDPNVQRITNVRQLIEHFTQSTSKITQLHSYLEDNHGTDVTLIIDGFDELNNELRKKSFFRALIKKKALPKARVVVTSRPTASVCLHQIVDRRIEILGFDQTSRMEYAKEALIDSPSKLEKLQKHFQQYPNIDAICYIPLIMSIIVFLCMCQPEDLPPTASKMYHSFVLHTIYHYLRRTGKIAEDEHINEMEHLPQPVQQVLLQLQKVAFDGLVEDKIVFTTDDLPDMCRDDPTCYGLLQSVECYCSDEIGTPTKSFNFLHLGIQEYFAAKYVATLPEDEVYTLLMGSFPVETKRRRSFPYPDSKSSRLSNMWIMYCGITGGQCNSLRHYLSTKNNLPLVMSDDSADEVSTIFGDYRPTQSPSDSMMSYQQQSTIVNTPSSSLVISQCLDNPLLSYPVVISSGSSLSPHVINTGSPDLMSYRPISLTEETFRPYDHDVTTSSGDISSSSTQHCDVYHPYQQRQLGYHPVSSHHDPSNSEHVTTNINTQVTSGKIIRPTIHKSSCISNTLTISHEILKDRVKVLYLFQCFQEAQDDKLCDILSTSFDSGEIDLRNNRLLPHQVVSLGLFLSRSHRKLKELILYMCYIGDHGINLLHHYLCGDEKNKQEITTIDLGYNDLTAASSPLIGDIITHLQPHTLMLTDNNITSVKDISTAVINTNILKVLYMWNNGLPAQEASAISDMMTCLEELYISDNKLGDDGAVIMSEQITKTNTLRVLDIRNNIITSTGAIAIANSLLHNTSLEVLYMNYNAIGQDGTKAIAQAITNNKILKKLYINNCKISTGATAIAYSLLHNTSLEVLDMSFNAIGQDGAIVISQAIINNKTLKELCVYDDDDTIDEESAMIIIRSLHHNNYITTLGLYYSFRNNDNLKREVEHINNTRKKCDIQELKII